MKTDLQLFQESGMDFQEQIKYRALYACYLSSLYKIPFCAHYVMKERDDYGHDYFNGFLHGLCIAQDNPLLCSRFIAITPFMEAVDWYLCISINDEVINLATQNIPLNIKSEVEEKFEILKNSYRINVNHIFSFAGKFNISQTSQNDDFCLYALSFAYQNQLKSIPLQIITSSTSQYCVVHALGFVDGLHMALGDGFKCTFDIENNFINDIYIDKEYFKTFTRANILDKNIKHNMRVDGVLDYIEYQVNIWKNLNAKVQTSRNV